MKIWYLGYYDIFDNREEQRGVSPAGVTKMGYIADVLSSIAETEIVSPAQTSGKHSFPGKRIKICDNLSLKLFPTFGRKNLVMIMISSIYRRLSLLFDIGLSTQNPNAASTK